MIQTTDLTYTAKELEGVKPMSSKFTPSVVEAAKVALAILEDANRDCETGYPDDHYREAILNIEAFLDDHA